jgi:ribose transport system permease protein
VMDSSQARPTNGGTTEAAGDEGNEALEVPRTGRLRAVMHFLLSILRFQDVPLTLVLVLMILIVGVFHPDYLSENSLINIAREASFIGIMSIGMVFLLSMREIDLSVGSIYGLTMMIAAQFMMHGMNPWVAALVASLFGILLGVINAVLILILNISSLIVTLGTLSCYSAVTLIVAHDADVYNLPTKSSFFNDFGGNWLTVPISIWVALVLMIVFHVVYRYTRFGFKVRAIGSNPEAARLAGIALGRAKIQALALQGLLCAIAGMVTLAYIGAADPTSGIGYELQIIAAAIIGGTALAGGSGTVIGAIVGALVISTIATGVVEFGLNADWGNFANGAVIIGAVAMDSFFKRRRLVAAEGVALVKRAAMKRGSVDREGGAKGSNSVQSVISR